VRRPPRCPISGQVGHFQTCPWPSRGRPELWLRPGLFRKQVLGREPHPAATRSDQGVAAGLAASARHWVMPGWTTSARPVDSSVWRAPWAAPAGKSVTVRQQHSPPVRPGTPAPNATSSSRTWPAERAWAESRLVQDDCSVFRTAPRQTRADLPACSSRLWSISGKLCFARPYQPPFLGLQFRAAGV